MTGNPSAYAFSSWVLVKGIAFVYAIAFLSALLEAKGLLGSRGLLPISQLMDFLKVQRPGAWTSFPTLFWISSSDSFIYFVLGLGLVSSLGAFFGVFPPALFLICWICYFSFIQVGRDFYSFQWDILLLEAGFLALFLGPWSFGFWKMTEPSVFIRWAFWLLVFKLMFLSGVVKLTSQDPLWRNLEALTVHYETQPLPNPFSWWAHQAPLWFQKASCAVMFAIELFLPFLIFLPHPGRLIAALGFLFLQVLIALTGNYTFFNLLTIVLSLFLIPDEIWRRIPWVADAKLENQLSASWYQWSGAPVLVLSTVMTLFWVFRNFGVIDFYQEWVRPLAARIQTFRLNNPYGLFASMTSERNEIVIEGSQDGSEWKEYEFRFKPGSLNETPRQIAPLQARLDWQMWFAALGTWQDNEWYQVLLVKLLEGDSHVQKFFKKNPFEGQPPRYLRGRFYRYKMTKGHDENIWNRELLGDYSPVVSLK